MDFEEKYKRKVDYNIEYLRGIKGSIKEKFDIKKYKEPDDIIGTKELQGLNISMSSDGICGIMKIIEYSKENEIIDNYKLIRNKFLVWPSYALSINQQRGYKNIFDDRIDLLLIDIKKLYDIISNDSIVNNNSSIITYKQAKEISECRLSRAYLNVYTLIWLKSFENFERFVDENNLNIFVEESGDKYTVNKWAENQGFCSDYFTELIARLKLRKRLIVSI